MTLPRLARHASPIGLIVLAGIATTVRLSDPLEDESTDSPETAPRSVARSGGNDASRGGDLALGDHGHPPAPDSAIELV